MAYGANRANGEDKENPNRDSVIVIAEEKNQKWELTAGPDWFKTPAVIDQLVPQKPLSCFDITNPDRHSPVIPAAPAQLPYPASTKQAQMRQTPPEQLFLGSADSFAAQLPHYIEVAAVKRGLEAHQYDPEAAYLSALVKTCASITPQMVHRATDKLGLIHLQKLGAQYVPCQFHPGFPSASNAVNKPWKPQTDRQIVYEAWYPSFEPGAAGSGFFVKVSFSKLENETFDSKTNLIVTADIH